jgi:hypothetical protein
MDWKKKISLKKIQLVWFGYVFSKNCDWNLCVAKNMYKIFTSCVWKCGCFSKCFLLGNATK